MVQVAAHFGADVTAVDVVDEKLDACLEYGATHAVDATEESLEDAADAPFDVVVDFVGDESTLTSALDVLGPRGRLVHLTTFPGNTHEVSPRSAVSNEISVLGSRYCSKHEVTAAADLVADGAITPVVSEVVDLAGVQGLLERITNDELLGRGAATPT
jgi:D-arabinose 1-dehydrogenase-like Zn-dependent alcohol dehydrogenase